MDRFYLPRGQRLFINDTEYLVDGALAEGRVLLRTATNNDALISTYDELRDWLAMGRVTLRVDDGTLSPCKQVFLRIDFESIPEVWRAEAERRFAYIKAYIESGLRVATPQSLPPLIDAVSLQLNDSKPPSWITLYRWIRSFEAAGRDIRGCISAIAYRGSSEPKVAEEVREIVDACIEQFWMPPKRCSSALTWRHVIDQILKANFSRPADEQLSLVSEKFVSRRIGQLDRYTRDVRQIGEREARLKYRAVKAGFPATRPNEYIEIDHTPIDLFVVDEVFGVLLGKPWLTVALDRATRMIIGFYISFNPPSYNSIALCLKNAILPKQLRDMYPQVEGEWPCWGNIDNIVVDRGSDFTSKHLQDACRLLKIHIEWNERQTPWHKGKVERFFRSISEDLFHTITGGLPPLKRRQKGERPWKNARVTLSGLRLLVHLWIVDYYSQKPHAGLQGRAPIQVWRDLCRVHKIHPFQSREDLNVLLGRTETARITKMGVRYGGLRYQADLLTQLRNRPDGSPDVTIKLAETVDHVFVLDSLRGTYHQVAVAKEFASYAANLTWYQHEVISRAARDEIKSGAVPIAALVAARARIHAEAERLIRKPCTRTQVPLARFRSRAEEHASSVAAPAAGDLLLPSPTQNVEDTPEDSADFQSYLNTQNWRVRGP